METIYFAIIGCGQIAQRHARQMRVYGNLVAVCDTIPDRADALAKEYGATPYYSIEDLLEKETAVDVVAICTPNGLHAEHTIRSLHAKHHVLVEKPMSLTMEDCDIMMQSARLAGRSIFPVVQNRFNPPVLAIKNALDANAFGKISSIQLSCLWNRPPAYYEHPWHGNKEMDGGILYTQFSHFIDLLYWFFGEVKTVKAITANAAHDAIDFEDCGAVALVFENGIIGTIHFSINGFKKNYEGSLTILGEKGTAKIGGEYLNTLEFAEFENYEPAMIPGDTAANDYGAYKGSMSNHHQVYANLVETLRNGKAFYASAYEGTKTVEIIERIYEAARGA